jgi:hypothetical protein
MLAPFSLTPVLDTNGNVIRTAVLQVFQAGTTTPVVLYKQADYANGTEHPNPIPVNGAGLLPVMFGAGAFKFRALTALVGGSIVWEADGVTLTDPPAAGGTGPAEDTTVAKTGDIKQRYDTGSHPGWVRLNGRTIGNASSGATERASADTQALFLHLWTVDDSLVVVGGRGSGSAQQDFDAGKALTLPNAAGRLLAGLDGMGAPASGSYGALTWNAGGSATRLGSATGVWNATLGIANLPAHDHALSVDVIPDGAINYNGTVGAKSVAHTHGVGVSGFNITIGGPTSIFTVSNDPNPTVTFQTQSAAILHDHTFNVSVPAHDHAVTATLGMTGSGTPLSIANPLMLVTTYCKL